MSKDNEYLCVRCEGLLLSVAKADERILVCSSCGAVVGFARRPPKRPMAGQLDIDGNVA